MLDLGADASVSAVISIAGLTSLPTLLEDRPSQPTCNALWRDDPYYCGTLPRRGGTCMVGLLLNCTDLQSCAAPSIGASPLTYALEGRVPPPPTLLMHGEDDCWMGAPLPL